MNLGTAPECLAFHTPTAVGRSCKMVGSGKVYCSAGGLAGDLLRKRRLIRYFLHGFMFQGVFQRIMSPAGRIECSSAKTTTARGVKSNGRSCLLSKVMMEQSEGRAMGKNVNLS